MICVSESVKNCAFVDFSELMSILVLVPSILSLFSLIPVLVPSIFSLVPSIPVLVLSIISLVPAILSLVSSIPVLAPGIIFTSVLIRHFGPQIVMASSHKLNCPLAGMTQDFECAELTIGSLLKFCKKYFFSDKKPSNPIGSTAF